jgi:hypothetical protein
MNTIRTGGVYAGVLRLLNEAQSLEELAEVLKNAKAAATDDVAPLVEAVAARKRAGGGTLKNEEELYAAIGRPGLEALRISVRSSSPEPSSKTSASTSTSSCSPIRTTSARSRAACCNRCCR